MRGYKLAKSTDQVAILDKWYLEYVQDFNEELQASGKTWSNALLKPMPMTIEEFARRRFEQTDDLAKIGFNRKKQTKKFGLGGTKVNKEKGEANRKAVLDAARAILVERTRKPSVRELATLIEKKTGIPSNTVRGHLNKLRKDKILD